MKYIVLVCDGMADIPQKEIRGRTPLEAARTPNMDFIAKYGQFTKNRGVNYETATSGISS